MLAFRERERQSKSHNAPVMLPIDASAPMSCNAALRLAKVSGKLVPIAIIVIPVTLFLSPTTQPKSLPS